MLIPSEPWLSEIVTRLLPADKSLAADVGANKGGWSRALAEEFLQVVAVEPDPRAYRQIGESSRITIAPFAIAEKTGEAMIYLRPSPEQNSVLESHPIGDHECVAATRVMSASMDDLFPDGCDFVKMDIEGGEVAALRGCTGNWSRTVFVVECHDTFAEVRTELERLGKTVERVPHPIQAAHPGHCWAIGK